MYCVHCGTRVGDRDRFCAKCGAQQSTRDTPPPLHDFMSGISPQHWAILCYVPLLGWIAAVIVLATQRFRGERRVLFHAFQGLYLFAGWLLVDWVVAPILLSAELGFPFYRLISQLLKLAVVGAGIFMMIRVSNGDDHRLPVIGDLADRSAAEQRT